MPVDNGNFIRIRMKNQNLFIDNSFRTIDLSVSQGIKAIIGKLKTDPNGSTVIESYLFDKKKWTETTAKEWVKQHEGKSLEYMVMMYKEIDLTDKNEGKIIKCYRSKILNVDSQNHTASVQVTTEALDRDKEILPLDSWKENKSSYEQHPVLVSSHKYDNLLHQIGEAVNINWTDMTFDFKWYAGEGNPEADWGWKLAEKGVAMFSVGFISHKILEGDAIPEEYRGKEPRRVLAENELMEVSQVIVGSNRGALQLGMDNPSQEQYQYAYEVMKSFNGDILEFDKKVVVEIKKPVIEPIIPEPVKSKINSDSIIISPVEIKNMAELQLIVEIYKSGRIISEKNRTILKSTVEQLQKSMQALMELLDLTNPTQGGDEQDGDGKALTREVIEFLESLKKS